MSIAPNWAVVESPTGRGGQPRAAEWALAGGELAHGRAAVVAAPADRERLGTVLGPHVTPADRTLDRPMSGEPLPHADEQLVKHGLTARRVEERPGRVVGCREHRRRFSLSSCSASG